MLKFAFSTGAYPPFLLFANWDTKLKNIREIRKTRTVKFEKMFTFGRFIVFIL